MIHNFFEIFLSIKFLLIGLLLVLWVLSLYWQQIFKFLNLKSYKNIQRAHADEVSRLGGFIIYIYLLLICLLGFSEDFFIFSLLLSSFPFVIVALREDLYQDTSPFLRLISMIISCLFFFYLNPIDFPLIEFPYLGDLISIYPIGIVFFTFSILIIMNGMNLIDGMNGLFVFTAVFQLLSLAIVANIYDDFEIMNISFILLLPLLSFLLFNFPFGKIFIGDLGAYFYGFAISLVTIYFFGKHQELLSWSAALLLFYPSSELLYSYLRKIINKQSPMDPDNEHLHSLIFNRLIKNVNTQNVSNARTTLILSFFWVLPPLLFIYNNDSIFFTLLSIMSLSILYIFMYKSVKKGGN